MGVIAGCGELSAVCDVPVVVDSLSTGAIGTARLTQPVAVAYARHIQPPPARARSNPPRAWGSAGRLWNRTSCRRDGELTSGLDCGTDVGSRSEADAAKDSHAAIACPSCQGAARGRHRVLGRRHLPNLLGSLCWLKRLGRFENPTSDSGHRPQLATRGWPWAKVTCRGGRDPP